MNIKRFFMMLLAVVAIAVACEKNLPDTPKEDEKTDPTGNLKIEMTDGPSDNLEVDGVFVTVADVKLDGESLEGFNKTTFDISAYQRGEVKTLFDGEVNAKNYSKIEFVLDNKLDASGNSPGNYVLVKSGEKYRLDDESNISAEVSEDFSIDSAGTTTVLIDFDLRKTITSDEDSESRYQFVTESEFDAGFKVLNKTESGTIKGEVNDAITQSDVMVVFAYEKDTYDADVETEGQGESNILFKNAKSSALVDANGNFEMHFLEKGSYELQFASYEAREDGSLELQGTLILDALNLDNVEVEANSTLNITLNVTGILGL